jgi:hypothetical protein
MKLLKAVVLGVAIATVPSPTQGRTPLPIQYSAGPPDFADQTSSHPLVVRGTILSVLPGDRVQIGGCGAGQRGPFSVWEVTIRVDQVDLGVAEDTVLTLPTVGQWTYPHGTLVPGKRALVWGMRLCIDGWMLWSHVWPILESGAIVGPRVHEDMLFLHGPGGSKVPVTETALLARIGALASTRVEGHLESASGLSIVPVLGVTADASGFVCHVGQGRPLVGSDSLSIQSISFNLPSGCIPDVAVGDSLLVPAGVISGTTSVNLNMCPRLLRVREGYSEFLAVPVTQFKYALDVEAGLIHQRKFLLQE